MYTPSGVYTVYTYATLHGESIPSPGGVGSRSIDRSSAVYDDDDDDDDATRATTNRGHDDEGVERGVQRGGETGAECGG